MVQKATVINVGFWNKWYHSEPVWSRSKKLLFRFASLFFGLFILINPNGVLPFFQPLHEFYFPSVERAICNIANKLAGSRLFTERSYTGSGDTKLDFLLFFSIGCISFLGTLVWTVFDRRSQHYRAFRYWLLVMLRYYVAFTFINYGFAKIFLLQFSFPSLVKLVQPIGDTSPMGLAWTFFGFSNGYNYFIGTGELLAGVFLLFRSTLKLGAISAVVVSLNVMTVNYCFDVCVKLLSTMLLMMSIGILLSQRRQHLAHFFSVNTAGDSIKDSSLEWEGSVRQILLGIKYILIGGVFWWNISDSWAAYNEFGPLAQKDRRYGIYEVQTFVRGVDTLAPLLTDSTRWKKIVIGNNGRAAIQKMNDRVELVRINIDSSSTAIQFLKSGEKSPMASMRLVDISSENINAVGRLYNDSVAIALKKMDLDQFLLLNRGFHLISEKPFNK